MSDPDSNASCVDCERSDDECNRLKEYHTELVCTNKSVQFTCLVREAAAAVGRILTLDLPDTDEFIRSVEGQSACVVLRRLVLLFAFECNNGKQSVVGWERLPPTDTASLTRLVLQLSVFNRDDLAAYRTQQQRYQRESAPVAEQSPPTSNESGNAIEYQIQLQERLESLVVHLRKPFLSYVELIVLQLSLYLSVLTVFVSWYAILGHAIRGWWLAALLTWIFMVLPDMIILRKESVVGNWFCSKYLFLKLVFPNNVSAILIESWLSGVRAASSSRGSHVESGERSNEAASDDYARCLSFRRRFEADTKSALNYLICVDFGFIPLYLLHSYALVAVCTTPLELTTDNLLMLIPPSVAYLLSATAGYTTFISLGFTWKTAPYIYLLAPRLKLFIAITMTVFARTAALALFLWTSPVGLIVGLFSVGSIFNAAVMLWLKNGDIFTLDMSIYKAARRLWGALLRAKLRMFLPYIIEPGSSTKHNVCTFLLDLLQVAICIGCSLREADKSQRTIYSMFLWLYLIGCALQWWTLNRFTPGEPRAPEEFAIYQNMTLIKSNSHMEQSESAPKSELSGGATSSV